MRYLSRKKLLAMQEALIARTAGEFDTMPEGLTVKHYEEALDWISYTIAKRAERKVKKTARDDARGRPFPQRKKANA